MSDAVSNTEIEDVLSSIRRLVADDAKKISSKGAAPERLVLTPSLRIKERHAETPARLVEGAEPTVAMADSGNVDLQAQEAGMTDMRGLGAIVEQEVASALDALQSGPQVLAEADGRADAVTGHSGSDIDVEVDVIVGAIAEQALDAPKSGPAPEENVLERKIAALEQMVSQNTGDWDQEEDLSDGNPMFLHNPARALDWKADIVDVDPETQPVPEEEEPANDFADPSDVDVFALRSQDNPTDHPDKPFVVTDIFRTAPEAADPETYKAAAPRPAAETVSPTVEADEQPDNVSAALQLDIGPPADDSSGEDLLAESSVTIDEDVLRDMVGDLVRQELQGALGERITRNVRKLVRREIQRVLVAKDFE